MKFSIWHLLLLTLLAAVYVAVRKEYPGAIILVLNDGTNHGSSYQLTRLPIAPSLVASIGLHLR